MLVWALIKHLQYFYPSPPVRELFAEAVTPEGERLLQRFRFELVSAAKGRRDPYPLYKTTLTSDALDLALSTLPDWSTRVRLGWVSRRRILRSV
jgi:hypothetical protein